MYCNSSISIIPLEYSQSYIAINGAWHRGCQILMGLTFEWQSSVSGPTIKSRWYDEWAGGHQEWYWYHYHHAAETKCCHFADVSYLFLYKQNVFIAIRISMRFIPTGPQDNMPVLVQIMGVFDWVIGNELIFRSWHFLIRLVPVTKQLHDRGYFVLTDQIWPVT